jgi:hypothetical protein
MAYHPTLSVVQDGTAQPPCPVCLGATRWRSRDGRLPTAPMDPADVTWCPYCRVPMAAEFPESEA